MNDVPLTVEGMLDYLKEAPPEKVQALAKAAESYVNKVWVPQPGPQYKAFHSQADELLYGGAAGGGKTDLLCGLCLTAHEKSLVFRRHSSDLDGFWDRLGEVGEEIELSNNSMKRVFSTTDGRKVEGGHLEKPGSEKTWQGRPHDFIGFDEGAQLDEYKVSFVMQWLRSTTEGQRCRMMVATNPPIPEYRDGKLVDFGTGDWLIRWWAPWLDDKFPNKAVDGELRWCYMKSEGDRMVTHWVDGPGYYDFETGELVANPNQKAIDDGKFAVAKSRTFIRSLLRDNSFLEGTGYAERIAASPEPLRTLLMTGQFNIKVEDNPFQIIPTAWVAMANERWLEREHHVKHLRQLVLAGDIAQGGADSTTYAPLYETDFFGQIENFPGSETPDGPAVVSRLLDLRTHKSLIVLDGTGGWAGDTYRTLDLKHGIDAELFVASKSSGGYMEQMHLKFLNNRIESWWALREALDPDSDFDVCLPPNSRLMAQLTAPIYIVKGKYMQAESKDELRARLQMSTDEADAVIMAWFYRSQAIQAIINNPEDIVTKYNKRPEDAAGNVEAPHSDYDPLADW